MLKGLAIRLRKLNRICPIKGYKDESIRLGSPVIIETDRGVEIGVIIPLCSAKNVAPIRDVKLKKVVRYASPQDLSKISQLEAKEAEGLTLAKEKIIQYQIPIKIIEAENLFDQSKVIFYYKLLEEKKDLNLRDLNKEISNVLKTKVEFKQIAPRDEARICGGLGPCGKTLCCASWLTSYPHVSVKLAKELGLSISPGKTSGICGRLLCCLKYEQPG